MSNDTEAAQGGEGDAMRRVQGAIDNGPDPQSLERLQSALHAETDRINNLARTLMAAWERAEGKPVNASYVATFADMARAVLDDMPKVATRRTDWGVRDDATGNVGTVGAYNRSMAEAWLAELIEPSTLMCRERTVYDDDLTEWVEVVTPSGKATS